MGWIRPNASQFGQCVAQIRPNVGRQWRTSANSGQSGPNIAGVGQSWQEVQQTCDEFGPCQSMSLASIPYLATIEIWSAGARTSPTERGAHLRNSGGSNQYSARTTLLLLLRRAQVVGKLLREPRLGQDSFEIGRFGPRAGWCWPNLPIKWKTSTTIRPTSTNYAVNPGVR